MPPHLAIGTEAFQALAAIGWITGHLNAEEASGLLGAARACGLEGDALAPVERATKHFFSLHDVRNLRMSLWERAAVYTLALWFTRVDGVLSVGERRGLDALARTLGLTPRQRRRASEVIAHVTSLPPDEQPARYDVVALTALLAASMPEIAPL